MKKISYLPQILGLSILFSGLFLSSISANAAHGYAQFGVPKYPADFKNFDYANPNAPKGGTLSLSNTGANSSFDKLNPFTLKGRPAPGLMELVFETLATYSLDEPNTQYGLLAKDIQVSPDFTSVTFTLHEQAKFNNGDPVTADDVKYSFDTLTGKLASPNFVAYFSDIKQVDVLDKLTVRFHFKHAGRDLPFVAGSLPVFSPKWKFNTQEESISTEMLPQVHPIASGPYQIVRSRAARDIIYTKRSDYWGNNIPVRVGTMNFNQVSYQLYKDRDTQVSGIRGGNYDVFYEHQMRYWCCQYIGKRFENGELIKQLFPHQNPPAMVGHFVNLRKERFQDVRVRKALLYALDFEWVNEKIFNNYFKRVNSYFANTSLAATGYPSKEELALLAPYKDTLDPAVFGEMVTLPSTLPPNSLRNNLEYALKLFAEAGWHIQDGLLRNDKGEPFIVEVNAARGDDMLLAPYYQNLKKIGVQVVTQLSDPIVTYNRLSNFDYDFSPAIGLRQSRTPAVELWRAFNSKDADIKGSSNILGLKSKAVDDLIQKMLNASSQEELTVTAHALDRILMHGYYYQPWRYITNHHIIYNKRLRYPDTLPLYYSANDWMLTYWWDSTATKQ
jgi:microcin C transport system substrate-binding protein